MDPLGASVIALLVLALLWREHQHARQLERQAERNQELVNDLASRVVRPQAPVRAPLPPAEYPDLPRSENHLVGSLTGPPSTEE